MKAITFLGYNPRGYEKTTYVHPEGHKECETEFIQEALVELYQPQTLFVLLTPTAETGKVQNSEATLWEILQQRLQGKVDLRPITKIPEGHTSSDIWTLFQQITNCIKEEDRVLFDITNGFRSLPVISLLVISYLRVTRNVQMEGLIYGAFDAKDKTLNRTPIFDLLPIVQLLELTTATDQFLKTGNANALATLLPESDIRASIENIAQGLHLLRPMEVAQQAYYLPTRIKENASIITSSVPPFEELLARIEQDYSTFGVDKPEEDVKAFLAKQAQMIEWYYDKKQYVHALSVAREWLPSLLCYHFNLPVSDKNAREEMELLLSGGTLKDGNNQLVKESQYKDSWGTIPANKALRQLWTGDPNLANLRNDVLHAGFRKNPKTPNEIIGQIEDIMKKLRSIRNDWELVSTLAILSATAETFEIGTRMAPELDSIEWMV